MLFFLIELHVTICIVFVLSFNIINTVELTTTENILSKQTFIQQTDRNTSLNLSFNQRRDNTLEFQFCFELDGALLQKLFQPKTFSEYQCLDVFKLQKHFYVFLYFSSWSQIIS